ncbi:hypothetical protein SEA_OTTAWA_102 [Arthrobacter phage Ottawa]|nr:hypothetical protein SEA_KHARCHO_102 [Arthrobacter phage Kharcho]WIC89334.1 hypothetical protein SEA_OTTAWA_102 [Arthrobacter phage Ottawa]
MPVKKSVIVGNTRATFRDSFANPSVTQPNPETWDLVSDNAGHIITQGGDSAGASYLRISLSPFAEDTEVRLTSRDAFRAPTRISYGVSISQRIIGQEVFAGIVGCDANLTPVIAPTPTPVAIVGTVTVASNVATINMPLHPFKGGDRVTVYGNTEPRLNVDPVVVTVVDAYNITVPVTLTNGTYTAGGYVVLQDPLGGARNGAGLLWENSATTNASFVSRRNGAKFRSTNSTVASSAAAQTNTNPYTDAFNATANSELYYAIDEIAYRSFAADSTAAMSGYNKYSQAVPDEDLDYKLQVRARIFKGATRPIARVVSANKTGTTTATIVTDVPHGLTASDWVQVYGIRDQTNFPALTSPTAIASIVNATTFTVVIGGAVTAGSLDGTVYLNDGGVAAPGGIAQAIQSITRTNSILSLAGSGTWSGLLPGEYVHLHGLTGAASAYEGAYKVLRQTGTTLDLAAPGPDFGSITTGGTVIKRTDVRLHWARVIDYTRMGVEVLGGKGHASDANNAVPATIASSVQLGVNATQTTGINTTQWSAAGWGGFLVADVASAAITSTATTSAVSPGSVANIGTYAHSFNVVVTAVSGTNPTMDIGIEESVDNGTNWVRIYDFQRITANGTYTTPLIRAQYGTRYRYVQTIAGTTPSFTRAINRVQFSSAAPIHKQFFDRSVNPNTLNSATPTYNVDGCHRLQLTAFNVSGTGPVYQLEGSEDGANWYPLGAPLDNTAAGTVVAAQEGFLPKYARARVSTAGTAAVMGSVSIKALGA